MSEILSLDYVFEILLAFTYVTFLSTIYKRTKLFALVNSILLGVALGHIIYINYNTFMTQTYERIIGGEPQFILAIIVGLLYFTAVIPNLRSIYRVVAVITLGQGLGIMLNVSMLKVWNWTSEIAKAGLTDIVGFVGLVFFATGLSTFLFHRRFSRGLASIPMQIGRWSLLIYAAFFIGTYQSGLGARIMFYILRINTGAAWWVPILVLAGILLDAVGVFRSIGLTTEAEARSAS
jgi:hypothetical protein